MYPTINKNLIAPCGMNCALCIGYLAYKNDLKSKGFNHFTCKGCRAENRNCSVVKNRCKQVAKGEVTFCFDCNKFPCKSVNQLDVRYKKYYRMSEIENLNFIKENGIRKFLKKEKEKWGCKKCGELISCHNGICYNCELDKLKVKKRRFRWED